MILAGRRTNDGMGAYVAGELVKLMAKKGVYRPGAKVLVLGLTFKENCPDLRNTRVIDVIKALRDYNLEVHVHDPWADPEEAKHEYGLDLVARAPTGRLRRHNPGRRPQPIPRPRRRRNPLMGHRKRRRLRPETYFAGRRCRRAALMILKLTYRKPDPGDPKPFFQDDQVDARL